MSALNVRAACLIATQFLGHGCMEALKTERSTNCKLRGSLLCLVYLCFDTLSMDVRTTRYWQTYDRRVQELNVCTVLPWSLNRQTNYTVQTSNSCTSRPDVCQCLVAHTPIGSMSKKWAKHINDPRSLLIKTTFICEVMPASMPRKRSGNRPCGSALCPGCPHLQCRN